MIAIISYLAHQASVEHLKSNSSVLNELSLTPRSKTGVMVSEEFVEMLSNQPVSEWAETMENADIE